MSRSLHCLVAAYWLASIPAMGYPGQGGGDDHKDSPEFWNCIRQNGIGTLVVKVQDEDGVVSYLIAMDTNASSILSHQIEFGKRFRSCTDLREEFVREMGTQVYPAIGDYRPVFEDVEGTALLQFTRLEMATLLGVNTNQLRPRGTQDAAGETATLLGVDPNQPARQTANPQPPKPVTNHGLMVTLLILTGVLGAALFFRCGKAPSP